MKNKTKAFILLMNEIHNINMQFYNNLIMIGRLFYLFYIFISESIKFYFNNFKRIYIYKLPKNERLTLVKSITHKLEDLNIIYVKVFQSLCLEKDILYENEKNYLLKYTDNVPYKNEEINYELLDILESNYNIKIESKEPINSGIIGIVFKGLDGNANDSQVIIKILKNDIKEKLIDVFNELEYLTYLISFIPYFKNFSLDKLFLDNKEILLDQINFVKEVTNIEIFRFKNQNLPEYRIPYVYKQITNIFENVIVMVNITGLTINELEKYDDYDKNEFGKLILKFGYISVLYNSAIHCDLHSGNIFFYKNNESSNLPKYQLGLIDFGIVSFPSKESQEKFYNFFYNIEIAKNYDNIFEKLKYFIESKKEINKNQIIELEKKLVYGIKTYAEKGKIFQFFNFINKVLKSYNMCLTKEFNQTVLSIQININMTQTLVKDIDIEQVKVFEELTQIKKLIEI